MDQEFSGHARQVLVPTGKYSFLAQHTAAPTPDPLVAGQGVHWEAPGAEEKVMAGQLTQMDEAVAPAVAPKVPATQLTQSDEPVPPVETLYVPREQLAQSDKAVAPVVARKVPAGQLVQEPLDLY